ncbi:MAG TPA: hypothetical protein PLQ76_06985, partial [bacterium]|nr:hypothetical protein [bacterium]
MKKSERGKTWDVVIVSRDVWSEVRRRRHFLAEEWSKERRVLFVEPPVSLPGLISGRPDAPMRDAETISFRPKPPRAVTQSIHVFTPVRPIPESIPGGHAVCMSLMAVQVRAAIRSLSLGSPVLWITPEYGVHLLHGVPHIFAVYDVTDDWTTASIPDKQRRRIEADDRRLLSLADMVFTVSPRLHEQKSARRPDAVLMPNGVIPEMYDIPTPPEPPELSGVTRPIAGYTGTLHEDRIDVDLVLELSSRAKDGLSFVFVGPNLLGEKAAAALASRRNIRLISAQPFFRLPDFVAHFDTCMIPHVLTPFTHSLDPIKAYE